MIKKIGQGAFGEIYQGESTFKLKNFRLKYYHKIRSRNKTRTNLMPNTPT
jgi:hypothetical protein